jgi:tetratricopeptide (TPR) repeat protein
MVTQATAGSCADELHRLDLALTELAGADGADAATRRAYLQLRHARLSGLLDELRAADTAVGAALRRYPQWPDLSFLRASADLDMHQPSAALARLDAMPELAESPAGLELRGAALEQLGRYPQAQECLTRVLAVDPSWQALASLALVRTALGDRDAADALYAQAEDELTAKQMSAFAWVRAARGDLAAASDDHETAWAHLRVASAAFPGYWLVESRVAGLLRREDRLDEAAAAYADIRARTGRPELAEALGEVHCRRGDHEQADRWQAIARAEYADSAARGEALYLHHHDAR